jgi:NADH:ubiquinone oxidoreductase subunit 5 (subunit L)/multisubunit Na+/H+ antiporter MnhA subunit
VYGWKPLKAGEMDRVEAAMRKVGLGWLYQAMANRFYFDILYQKTFVNGAVWLADVFDAFDYGQPEVRVVETDGEDFVVRKHGAVDGIFTVVGRLGELLSEAVSWCDVHIEDGLVHLFGHAGRFAANGLGVFDLRVVDGVVNGVGGLVKAGGKVIRPLQTGKVQNYLLLASLMVLALILAFFMILYLQI